MTTSDRPAGVLAGAAVVVVNYGSHALLEANLVRVSAANPELTCVVVDNFTTASERDSVAGLGDIYGWTVVSLDTNTGFGLGVNVGVDAAIATGCASVLVLNPDAFIDRESITRLIAAVSDDPLLMITPTVREPGGKIWFAGADVLLDDGRMSNPARRPERGGRPYREWLSGACFALSVELWRKSGGFDPDYFLYWEDVDLSYRVQKVGGRLEVDAEATAMHAQGGTHTEKLRWRAKSETYYYYNIRNRRVYAAKHVDAAQRTNWVRLAPRVSYEILLRGGRAQFLLPLIPVRAWVRGIRDGRRFIADQKRA
jgi:N-acetylglucosaminyl-diphospho-decaprenol L-rhamnosyltransferase